VSAAAVQPSDLTGPMSARGWHPQKLLRIGVLGGFVAIYLCLVGIVPVFGERPLVRGVVSLGQAALLMAYSAGGYIAARDFVATSRLRAIVAGGLVGAIMGAFLTGLVLLGSVVDLRAVFLNASPELYALLTNDMGTSWAWYPIVVGTLTGALAGVVIGLPSGLRVPLLASLGSLVFFGLFAGLLRTPMLDYAAIAGLARYFLASEGLTVPGAILVLVGSFALAWIVRTTKPRQRVNALPTAQRRLVVGPLALLAMAAVLLFPLALGPFFAQVIALVALFVLLGLGLNITLGLAGLLDLGFVAFYAVGAYTVALLTSTAEYGIAGWSFWQAVPFAVIFAMLFGLVLGLPILRIRGDYLAIATLGFGEIIRLLAASDLLKPILGGPRGILNIPKPIPVPPTHFLAGPVQIYYIALAFAAVVAFVAWRLRGSRLGRSWMAIREDEDVAEGMGVNLVQTKLLAYMLGGAFAGLAGAISAGLVGSIFASSIQLQLSINVVAIVIVGGMGSIPGVVLGALFLIGLPELFREFSDYRLLAYGVALMAIMIVRPEGLLPSKVARRELHAAEELIDVPDEELIETDATEETDATLTDDPEVVELYRGNLKPPTDAGGPS
jgi:branched-chain amino acid transport system permease protein